jgi:hypothetical protein
MVLDLTAKIVSMQQTKNMRKRIRKGFTYTRKSTYPITKKSTMRLALGGGKKIPTSIEPKRQGVEQLN